MSEPSRASVPPSAAAVAVAGSAATGSGAAGPAAIGVAATGGVVRLAEAITGRVAVVAVSESADRAAVAAHAARLLRQRLAALEARPDVVAVHARRVDDGALVDGVASGLSVVLQTSRVPVVAERLAERLRRPGTAVYRMSWV